MNEIERLNYEVRSNLSFTAINNGSMASPTNTLQISEMTDFIVNGDLRDTATVRLGKYISKIMQWNDIIKVPKNEDSIALYTKSITEKFEEFTTAIDASDDVKQVDKCISMIWDMIGFLRAKGYTPYTIDKLFTEVDRYNFSKFFENEDGVLECIGKEDGLIGNSPDHLLNLKSIIEAN